MLFRFSFFFLFSPTVGHRCSSGYSVTLGRNTRALVRYRNASETRTNLQRVDIFRRLVSSIRDPLRRGKEILVSLLHADARRH